MNGSNSVVLLIIQPEFKVVIGGAHGPDGTPWIPESESLTPFITAKAMVELVVLESVRLSFPSTCEMEKSSLWIF